ncbi:MAG: alpha/beta hydrolase [Microbacteriaceae bacterium]|nr:alpha/beta hydrolase [Microbacteriaceae bacterium]
MPAAIILVHGLRTSATMWRQPREELERRGIRVVTVDLPGHGTRIAERFSFDTALAVIGDAVAIATVETGVKPYLVGFSLGGYLAIEYLARHPGTVCGLLAASCGTAPNRIILGGWRLIARAIHRLPDRGRLINELAVRAFVPPIGAADVLAGGAAIDVMDDALSELRALDPIAALIQIAAPVLFVNGQLDHFRMHERRYLKAAANSRLVTIAGSTHMVSVTRPQQFTAALLTEYATVTDTASLAAVSIAGCGH